jgi:hypothetical protein
MTKKGRRKKQAEVIRPSKTILRETEIKIKEKEICFPVKKKIRRKERRESPEISFCWKI